MERFQAQVGDVFLLWCNICEPQKYKFFVVAYIDPRLRYMLINSEPARFQQGKPELMRHQVSLSARDHAFLTHDSYLDCSQVLGGMTEDELESAYRDNTRIRLGSIAPAPRQALRDVVVNSRVLTERDKRMLLEAW